MTTDIILFLTSKANQKGIKLIDAVKTAGIDQEKYKTWVKKQQIPTTEEIDKLCEVIGCERPEKKREKHMEKKPKAAFDTAMNPPTETVESQTPNETKSAKPVRKTDNVIRLADIESEKKIREKLSLKKTEPLTNEKIISSLSEKKKEAEKHVEDVIEAVRLLAGNMVKETAVDPRYKELLKAAENATDEGIEVAIAVLKKMKKQGE